MQQRGISIAALDVLLAFGREVHDHRHGCRVVRFDKRTRRRAALALGPLYPKVERSLGTYAVIANDDAVVTVGHRTRRRKRPG